MDNSDLGGCEDRQLHIFLFPFMAFGHMIPMVDMAKLLASRGLKITIITTPINSIYISKSIHKMKTPNLITSTSYSSTFSHNIQLLILKFPSAEVGLPEHCETLDSDMRLDMVPNFLKALSLLEAPLESVLLDKRPHCLIADMLFPWTNDIAAKLGIPRLIFHGTSIFSLCVNEFVALHQPYNHVSSDSEPFTIPNLPGDIKFTKLQIPDFSRNGNTPTEVLDVLQKVRDAELKGYGVVSNSFYELERDYADSYRDVLGKKVWMIGPLFLHNKETEHKVKVQRGKESTIDDHECMKWLNSKEPKSVVYICFGTLERFNSAQLKEIAYSLEASGQQFIWVVKKQNHDEEDCLPQGFEERIQGKGFIIRGWAPQILILSHSSIGGFVTHCGWNSTLEGITAGVPMVTWPMIFDQFHNEKLVTEILKIGVPVGVKKSARIDGEIIERDAIEKALKQIMVGEESEKMRSRARKFGDLAWQAVEKDGSSFAELNALIQELTALSFAS